MKKSNSNNIRSIYFTNNLENKDFVNSQGGHHIISKILVVGAGIFGTILSSIISLVSGVLLANVFKELTTIFKEIDKYYFGEIELGLVILVPYIFFLYLATNGIKIDIFFVIAFISSIIIALMSIIGEKINTIIESLPLIGFTIVIAYLGIIIIGTAISFTSVAGETMNDLLILSTAIFAALAVTGKTDDPQQQQKEIIIYISEIATIFTGYIISRKAIRGSPQFALIKKIAIFLSATGGTSFYGVDLTDACFDNSHLPHTDFRKAILTRASFKNVTGLELSRLQDTILEDPHVRKLLTNPEDSAGKDYTEANLSGANLRGANLARAILIGAKLNGADLTDANLEGANLSKAQLLDVDFSRANLTETCIEDWSINSRTCFKDVNCQRIYIKQGKHGFLEPKPDSGEFQDGEFERWIDQLQETVDILLHDFDFDFCSWKALGTALDKTANKYQGINKSRWKIEQKDENVVLVQISVSPTADKPVIHQSVTNNYYNELSIQGHKANILLNPSEKVEIMENKNENPTVSGDLVSGDKTTSGDVHLSDVKLTNSGSMALVNLNGQINNTIQQLQDIKTEKGEDLATILTALQESINHDSTLSETQKQEALEAVETIAEEAKKTPGERVLKLCSMALNALKGLAAAVTDTSKLATTLKTYLPTLTALLDL